MRILTAFFAFVCLALSSRQADAQVSYQYTGNRFNVFCGDTSPIGICGPNPSVTSYTTSDFVTATLTLDQPLAANLNAQDVKSLPGFKVTIADGHQTLVTTAAAPIPGGSIVEVSTDAAGQIIAPWRIVINETGTEAANNGIATINRGTSVWDSGFLHGVAPYDGAYVFNSPGIWVPAQGGGSAFGTVTRVILGGDFPIDDIRGDVGKVKTTGLAATRAGIQGAYPKITQNGLSSGAWSDSTLGNGSARGVAFRTFLNSTGSPLTFRVNAILSGDFEPSWFGLPTGPLNAGGAIHVFDATMFNNALNASGTTAGQFLLGGSPFSPQTSPGASFQHLVALFPGAAHLSDGSAFFANGPFNQQLSSPVSTGFFTVAPAQTFTVVFDVATSSQIQSTVDQIGGGDVYFLDTLSPAPNFFTDATGNPVTGIVAAGSAPVLPSPATSLVLTPATATNPAGGSHTVTATATTAAGEPVPDVIVKFAITTGPNAGLQGGGATDANGQATFTYTDVNGAGTDAIQAQIGALQSNSVQKIWQATHVSCPQGPGYWKTNPGAWPAISLILGNQTYGKPELLQLLGASGAADASAILAAQLITAKLNIAGGSDPAPIGPTIAAADALLSGFSGKLPYQVKPNTAAGQAMTQNAGTLDGYNSGKLTRSCKQ